MDRASAAQYLAFVVFVTLMTKPLGEYLYRVFARQRTILDGVCLPLERLICRLCRIDPAEEMTAPRYIGCFLMLGGLGALFVYAVLRLQQFLPGSFLRTIRRRYSRTSRSTRPSVSRRQRPGRRMRATAR
jgi:potassium-transporting ATPase potassium-binding subunit